MVHLILLLAATIVEPATKTGDIIGIATMLPNRAIEMQLRSVQCDGTIAESVTTVRPEDRDYSDIVAHIGGLSPSEKKPIPAWPTEACP